MLGDTQFDEDDEWGDDANNDEEDFELHKWDEEQLNTAVRVDMGQMYQQEKNKEVKPTLLIRDKEEPNKIKGAEKSSTNNMETTGDSGEEEKEEADTTEGAWTNDNKLKEKYPTSQAQDGARGLGEKTK